MIGTTAADAAARSRAFTVEELRNIPPKRRTVLIHLISLEQTSLFDFEPDAHRDRALPDRDLPPLHPRHAQIDHQPNTAEADS